MTLGSDLVPGTWRVWPPRDRRFHHRSPADARAAVRVGRGTVLARCSDVSLGGVAIRSEVALAVGTEVDVAVELAPGRLLRSSGQVVRRAGDTLGIRFLRLEPKTFAAILAHLVEADSGA